MIIDFHTHAFPKIIAAKAIPTLERAGKIMADHEGTVDSLLESMDTASIEKSVICSIATHPSQFEPIFTWSTSIQSERIIPLPSVHPDDHKLLEHLTQIQAAGFLGIKMHPYYQKFFLDEERLFPLYQALSDLGLLLVVHCGYDIAFEKTRLADPARILKIHRSFPELKLVTTHLGGWNIWDEVNSLLIGKNIIMELSFALNYLSRKTAKRMLENHPHEYLLFGSDSPWDNQLACIQRLQKLGLTDALLEAILYTNGKHLLNVT